VESNIGCAGGPARAGPTRSISLQRAYSLLSAGLRILLIMAWGALWVAVVGWVVS
jgi:hypothetical protein